MGMRILYATIAVAVLIGFVGSSGYALPCASCTPGGGPSVDGSAPCFPGGPLCEASPGNGTLATAIQTGLNFTGTAVTFRGDNLLIGNDLDCFEAGADIDLYRLEISAVPAWICASAGPAAVPFFGNDPTPTIKLFNSAGTSLAFNFFGEPGDILPADLCAIVWTPGIYYVGISGCGGYDPRSFGCAGFCGLDEFDYSLAICLCPAPNDCNGNGIADGTDIAGSTSEDCNYNGYPDECETASCPAGSVISQPPGKCLTASGGSFENYSANADISGIRWWGQQSDSLGYDCPNGSSSFQISFHLDNNGQPGAAV